MKMTEKNERLQHLFKYFELLIEAEGKSHKVNREITEVVKEVRKELELTSSPKGIDIIGADGNKWAIMDSTGFYAKGGSFSIERPDGELWIQDGYFVVDSSELKSVGTSFVRKEAKFLTVDIAAKPVKDRSTFQISVYDNKNKECGTLTTTMFSNNSFNTYKLIADLGEPDNKETSFYIKVKVVDEDKPALIRVNKQSLQG